jgi:hypothetical protein
MGEIKQMPARTDAPPNERKLNTSLLLEIYGDGTRNSDFVTRFPKNFKCPPDKSNDMVRLMEMHMNSIAFAFESMINFYEEHGMASRNACFEGLLHFMAERMRNDVAGIKVADLSTMNKIIVNSSEGKNITKQLDKIDR